MIKLKSQKLQVLIIEFNGGSKNAPDFEFEFEVEGEKYEGRHLIVTKLGQNLGVN